MLFNLIYAIYSYSAASFTLLDEVSRDRNILVNYKHIVRMVKSINKQVPTDLFRPYLFIFFSKLFFFFTFSYNTKNNSINTQYNKNRCVNFENHGEYIG